MASSPLSIEERRRRRDQQLAVQAANQIVQQAASERRTITLEWAVVALVLALGVATGLGVWYRHFQLSRLGSGAWLGVVAGAAIASIILGRGRGRLTALALSIFAGVPLAAIPLSLYSPRAEQWPLFAIAAAAGALFGGGVRGAIELRSTAGAEREYVGSALANGWHAFLAWLHDSVIKCLAALIVAAVGAALIYFGRQQSNLSYFWAGWVVVFLAGSVGLWVPGTFKRTPVARALRNCGQLAFWLGLLVVPLFEPASKASLPYVARPSARFLAVGLGLVVIGATWFLQKRSLIGHPSRPPGKGATERVLSLIVLVIGLAVTLAAASAYQRMNLTVSPDSVSSTNIAGSLVFRPTSEVKSLEIVQPVERLPFYVEYLQFQDSTSWQVFSFLYPGDQLAVDEHPLIESIRLAARLNQESLPASRVEVWSR